MIGLDMVELAILIGIFIAIGMLLKLYKNKSKFLFYLIFCIYIAEVVNLTLAPMDIYGGEPVPLRAILNFKIFENGFQYTDMLNIAMTIPFGILLPFITKFKPLKMIIANFLFGFLIELLQFIEWLIMDFSMRIVDINDLICNFIGGCLGSILFVIFAMIYNKIVQGKKLPQLFQYIYQMTDVSDIMKNKATKPLVITISLVLIILIIFLVTYTRSWTIKEHYPSIDLSKCTKVTGYFFNGNDKDDTNFVINAKDNNFDKLLDSFETAKFKKKFLNLLPTDTQTSEYDKDDYLWNISFHIGDKKLNVENFFGKLYISLNEETTLCSIDNQEQWSNKIMDIISEYAIENPILLSDYKEETSFLNRDDIKKIAQQYQLGDPSEIDEIIYVPIEQK